MAREKAYSQDLQRTGKWPHIWRIVGEYANYSTVDVETNEELHQTLSAAGRRGRLKLRTPRYVS